jgi:hypothetical protein
MVAVEPGEAWAIRAIWLLGSEQRFSACEGNDVFQQGAGRAAKRPPAAVFARC